MLLDLLGEMMSARREGPPYDLIEHRHRVAVWAAARAASRGVVGVKVEQLMRWIGAVGLRDLLRGWDNLPAPEDFDQQHRKWCVELIRIAAYDGKILQHGGSAKLVNCYLKIAVVCASSQADGQVPAEARARIGAIHPPIDRLLMAGLAETTRDDEQAFFRRQIAWSTLNHGEYQAIIERLKAFIRRHHPYETLELWRVEAHWIGHA